MDTKIPPFRKLKIAITADPAIPVPPIYYGGIERIIFMLVEALVAQGHEVTLFAHKESIVPCRLIPYPGISQSKTDVIRNTLLITKTVLRERFDVIHSFGRLAYLTFLMPTRLRKIMSYQREPTISQVKLAMKVAKKGSMIFTGCSEYIARQISPFAPAYAVHNFVDTNIYSFTNSIDADAPLVFLGRVEYIKGAHIAIEVALKSGRKLVIAGNIPNEAEHKAYFEEKIKPFIDDDRITYTGPVNDDQKNDLLGRALAFLMPIMWNEPFGIVMAEAMACGTPILGFNLGAVPEVIINGFNGFICKDANEMVERINDIGLISRLNVRKDAEERFSHTKIVSDYLKLYRG